MALTRPPLWKRFVPGTFDVQSLDGEDSGALVVCHRRGYCVGDRPDGAAASNKRTKIRQQLDASYDDSGSDLTGSRPGIGQKYNSWYVRCRSRVAGEVWRMCVGSVGLLFQNPLRMCP